MERIDKIRQKLSEIGENYDDLKPFMKEYLEQIEKYIESKDDMQKEAIIALKNASYNISDVSQHLGCSRTTLYNHNQLLKRYINISVLESEKKDPFAICEEIKKSRQQLQEQLNLMENRDIDIEIQRHEKQVLLNKISEQSNEIERLRARVHELSEELHKTKAITPQAPKIIPLK